MSVLTIYDAVIVGAGPAGSATATLLARAGHRVLLVDGAHFPRHKPCAEFVSPGADPLFARLGVLPLIDATVGRRARGMILHAPGGAECTISYGTGDSPRWGRALPRGGVDLALLEAAREAGAEVWEGFRVTQVDSARRVVRGVFGRRGAGPVQRVVARLVVGADGVHSAVARSLRLRQAVRWPHRLGLVAHLDGVPWPEEYGQMHVGPRGYVGVAPLGGDRVSVGLVRTLPRSRLGPAAAALNHALADYPALASRLRGARLARPVQGVGPLGHAVRTVAGPGFLLVGDAAGFFDPFTGEGIYRALRGAEIAAGAADRALRSTDSGPVDVGVGYASARREAFAAKERLTRIIQVFVHVPELMRYAVVRLRDRPALRAELGNVLGDLAPADPLLSARFLGALLRP